MNAAEPGLVPQQRGEIRRREPRANSMMPKVQAPAVRLKNWPRDAAAVSQIIGDSSWRKNRNQAAAGRFKLELHTQNRSDRFTRFHCCYHHHYSLKGGEAQRNWPVIACGFGGILLDSAGTCVFAPLKGPYSEKIFSPRPAAAV